MNKQKRKINKKRTFLGYVGFFLMIAVYMTASSWLVTYLNYLEMGVVTIALINSVIVAVAAGITTCMHLLYKRLTTYRTIDTILAATDSIAQGKFHIYLPTRHKINNYDEYDYIIENINLMAQALEKNSMLSNDFVSNFSHEIKTPLAAIQNYATFLKKEKDEEKRSQYADVLVSSTQRLTNLVTNILKLNKLENQKILPSREELMVGECLRESVIDFMGKIEEKEIDLQLEIQDFLYTTDRSFLEVIWNNLLSNAIKFTPQGGTIAVHLSEDKGDLLLQVKDSGCGMDRATGEKIFEKFYQGDTSHAQEGNGLGLALVRKVVDILGGEISVKSKLGAGTTFTVRLRGQQ